MADWKDDVLVALLDCGYGDLGVLDDCKYDLVDDIAEMLDCEMKVTLNGLAWAMFRHGLSDIRYAIEERIEELEERDELSDEEQAELDELQTLDPYEDTESFHNFIDTSIWFRANKDIYEKYLQTALAEFEKNTGYSIG